MKKLTALLLCLGMLLPVPHSVEARSYSKPSTPSKSSAPSTPSKSFTPARSTSSNNNDTKTTRVESNSVKPSSPVNATSNAIKRPPTISTSAPANAKVISNTYTAPNPTNLPTKKVYQTRYDERGTPYSLLVVVPVGTDTIRVPDTYFPVYTRSSTTIVDNTPTNGFDVVIALVVIGAVVFVIIVFAFIGSRN